MNKQSIKQLLQDEIALNRELVEFSIDCIKQIVPADDYEAIKCAFEQEVEFGMDTCGCINSISGLLRAHEDQQNRAAEWRASQEAKTLDARN